MFYLHQREKSVVRIDKNSTQKKRLLIWFVAIFFQLAVWYFSSTGMIGLVVDLLGSTTYLLCFMLILRKRFKQLSADIIVLSFIGCGTFLSLLYILIFDKIASLEPLSVLPSDVPSYIVKSILLTLSGVVSFSVFYYSFTFVQTNNEHQSKIISKQPEIDIALKISVVILSLIGICSTIIFVSVNGGISSIISIWNDRDSVESGPRLLIYAMPLASLFWLANCKERISIYLVLHCFISFAFLTISGSRNEGLRFTLASLIIMIGVPNVRYFFIRNKHIVISSLISGFLVYTIIIGGVRSQVKYSDLWSYSFFNSMITYLFDGTYLEKMLSAYYLPSIRTVAQVMVVFPSIVPYESGGSFMQALDPWIPNFIWSYPSDINVGKLMFQIAYGSEWDSALFTNYIGELYLNWGFISVPIGMGILGLVCRLISFFWVRYRNNPWMITFYALFVGIFLPFFLTVEAVHTSFYSFVYFYLWLASLVLYFIISFVVKSNNQWC